MQFKFSNTMPNNFLSNRAQELGLVKDESVLKLDGIRVNKDSSVTLFFKEYPGEPFDSSLFIPDDDQGFKQLVQTCIDERRHS